MAIIKNKTKKKSTQLPFNSSDINSIYKFAEGQGIETCPFDITSLIKSAGIEIVYTEMDEDISGSLQRYSDNEWRISVNQYHSVRRQRFTLAHEFAHFVHGHNEQCEEEILFRANVNNPIEDEANEFASNLLISDNKFRDLVSSGVRDLEKIADYFQVSLAASRYKAYKLGYISNY
jgi:Zn-dependent peptidase ImmA (M78 family)